jgi:multiple sugar transport system permease protein
MRSRGNQFWWIALFLAPNLCGFAVFMLVPVLLSLLMAFTNWSLKPAMQFEFVGLRNFTDLLLVRPLQTPQSNVLIPYLIAVLFGMAGLMLAVWANIAHWHGRRWGSAGLAVLGALLAVGGIAAGAGQGLMLAGALLLLCGALGCGKSDVPWNMGRGVLGPLLLAVGCLGLWLLHEPMWHHYEPRDARFWRFFYNTLYLMLGIPFSIAGSLLLALVLNQKLPLQRMGGKAIGTLACAGCGLLTALLAWHAGAANWAVIALAFWLLATLGFAFNVVAFRTIFYLPSFTSGVALMILWKALYNPRTGPINVALEALCARLGLPFDSPNWLGTIELAKPALILMGIWTTIGGTNMLLYLAALANMPQELLDAAQVDGAGPWARIRHVIWPQLAPTTFFITIMSIIGGMQGGFDQARVMTSGGPAGSTTTLSYYIYLLAFQNLDLGYAAAISWILFAIIFVATALNWKFGKGVDIE